MAQGLWRWLRECGDGSGTVEMALARKCLLFKWKDLSSNPPEPT